MSEDVPVLGIEEKLEILRHGIESAIGIWQGDDDFNFGKRYALNWVLYFIEGLEL